MYVKYISLIFLCTLILSCASTRTQFSSDAELNAKIDGALQTLYDSSSSAASLAKKASGILVFPNVVKGGIGLGGEFGEGALLVNGAKVDYYNVISGSLGLQLGLQSRAQAILFMNNDVLTNFRNSNGWEAGVDGSIAIANLGAGGEISTDTAQRPIIGFIFSNKGLMYNLTLEGSKITRIQK